MMETNKTLKRLFVWSFILVGLCLVANGESKSDKIEAFVNWLDDNNFYRNFELREIPGQGVGGIATRPLTDEDYLLKVPVSKLVFAGDHQNINGWENWSGRVDAEPLVIFLLREKLNPNSPWKPYLDIIPSSFEEHPLFWPEEDLEFATHTGLVDYYVRTTHVLKDSYQHLVDTLIVEQPDLFPEGYFSWNNYLWAFLGVTTRAWSIAERGNEMALVPLADMLNHRSGAGQGGMNGRKQFVINSTQSYSPGEQVYDSYGPKTNFELLSYYGFVPDGPNAENGAILEITLNTNSNLVHKTVEPILKAEDPNYSRISVKLNEVPNALLRMFRISSLEFSQLDWLNDIIQFKGVSLDNERKAMRNAIASLQQVIASYPSEEEELALLEGDLNDNKRSVIRLRMSEKQVLQQTINNIRQLWQNILLNGELLGGKKI